jgi:hypothetical protein
VKFGTLSATHPEFDAEQIRRLALLFRGGYAILRCAHMFVPQTPGETPERYQHRMKFASYVNHLAPVIGYITGSLFSTTLAVAPGADADKAGTPGGKAPGAFWVEFGRDADLTGRSFSSVIQEATADALLQRRALLCVDLPTAAGPFVSRADEEATGAGRGYVVPLPLSAMPNWGEDASGELTWAVVATREKVRGSLEEAATGAERWSWKLWRRDEATGAVTWSEYQITRKPDDPELRPDDEIPPVSEDVPTSFRQIPIVILELPEPLWAGEKAGPLAEEHFRRRSELGGAITRGLVEVPFIKRGPEVPAMGEALPSETQQNPHRGAAFTDRARQAGWVAIGSDDEIGFAGPSGRAYEISAKERDAVRDEIHRTLSVMALSLANTGAVVGRSGESKREDRNATIQVLRALGTHVKSFAEKVYRTLSEARGEDVAWTAHGIDTFDLEDRGELVKEAIDVDTLAIPSVTFARTYKTRVALALAPNASPQDKAQIQKEIQEGITEIADPVEALLKHQPPPGGEEPDEDEDEDEDEPPESKP